MKPEAIYEEFERLHEELQGHLGDIRAHELVPGVPTVGYADLRQLRLAARRAQRQRDALDQCRDDLLANPERLERLLTPGHAEAWKRSAAAVGSGEGTGDAGGEE